MSTSSLNASSFHSRLKMQSWQKIMLGLVLGVVVGFFLGPRAQYLKPIGDIFINAIHMMITPLVFTAIVCAVTSVNDPQKMRRVGTKTILLYMVCMAAAAIIGISIAAFIAPGTGLHLAATQVAGVAKPQTIPSVIDMIVSMVPANPIGAFADGNILQILIFALVLGIAINLAGEKAQPVAHFFKSFSHVVFKLAGIVMSFAPYGIFALMAWVSGEFGLHALIPLMKLVGTIYLCFILQIVIVYCGSLALIARLNPIKFIKGIADAIVFAFSSSSSGATLPTTMRCAEENLGISKSISRFLLPLGCSLNMNGLSIYLGAATVFAANIYGVHLGMLQYLTVVLSIVLTSMGAGAVPGSAIIVMSAVMSSVGLPIGAVALIAGVDRLLDMGSTTTNLMGDVFTATMIAKSENELDEKIYNAIPSAVSPAQSGVSPLDKPVVYQ